MGRAAALLLIFATVVALQQFAGREAVLSSVPLALGFALIAASLLGALAERLRMPRLSGYLIFGLLCGPYLLNLITSTMARELQVVNGLAIAIIAFVAGLELNIARLRPRIRPLLVGGGIVVFGMIALFTALLFAAWPWLPFGDAGGPLARLAAAIVSATLVVSFSPTVTIAVIAESRARGPFTEMVLATVVLTDLLLIVVFALGMQLARSATGFGASDVPLIVELSWEILGSIAFGAIVGAVFALYLKAINRELTLALLGVCVVLAAATPALHFELILASLAAGLVVENIAPPAGDALKEAVERGALPVLIVFFAAAGASLRLDALAVVGTTALGIALLRVALIRWLATAGSRVAQLPEAQARLLWMGLVSQAGVTLGLATLVAAEFPAWGGAVQTLVVSLTGLHVLAGPILLKAALQRAGELGGMDADVSPVAVRASASPPTTG